MRRLNAKLQVLAYALVEQHITDYQNKTLTHAYFRILFGINMGVKYIHALCNKHYIGLIVILCSQT